MSHKLALLERLYEGWNRDGVEFFENFKEHIDPDVEFEVPPDFPGAETYRGIDQWRSEMERQLEGWTSITFEAKDFDERGDEVLATVRARTVGRESGIETERLLFHIWTFTDDRIVRGRTFFDEEDAREEFGTPAADPVDRA